ncbi:MAG TPA: UvrB/UvrC motif-containing protein [Candidatus Sumerlaeota bacterium]|nr:UvrB/UvrC motif-containing protein [Candidatus Sumerlaeota bacterium]HOR28676.1 UvrB/UvrC motif-containing protein [Candidatus Sumerlaeota bacterium]HPK02521.1 UvrB/UvrC motif-containing protein [Candidatus Sumerlaeota bacterium]
MKCGEPATHKFTRIEKGQIFDVYLCDRHAAETSQYIPKPEIPLSEILEGLLKQEVKAQSGSTAPAGVVCSQCGLRFEAYKRNLMLGCDACYESFEEYLVPDLRRFHGETRHIGRKPGGGRQVPDQQDAPARHRKSAGSLELSVPPIPQAPDKPVQKKQADPAKAEREHLIRKLRREMQEAIASEDFARAAECRDQIRALAGDMQQAGSDAPAEEKE